MRARRLATTSLLAAACGFLASCATFCEEPDATTDPYFTTGPASAVRGERGDLRGRRCVEVSVLDLLPQDDDPAGP